jgi:hypothetical protein
MKSDLPNDKTAAPAEPLAMQLRPNNLGLRPSGIGSVDEQERQSVDRMAARADQMEKICRHLITDAKVAYVRDKSEIDDRYRDELAKLEANHVRRMTDLEHSLRRIEALRTA